MFKAATTGDDEKDVPILAVSALTTDDGPEAEPNTMVSLLVFGKRDTSRGTRKRASDNMKRIVHKDGIVGAETCARRTYHTTIGQESRKRKSRELT